MCSSDLVPYAQELRELGVDETALKELAEIGNGGVLENPREVFQKDRRSFRVSVQLWPWLIGLAACLLLLEIALRRLGLGVFSEFAERRRARHALSGA